jgi:UDP-glucose 4-epimerase
MRTLLITGAAGFLGRACAHYFSRRGWQVYGVDRAAAENAPLADLQDYAMLALPHQGLIELLAKWQPQACIHAAGRASVQHSMQDPQTDFQEGPILTFHVLDSLRQAAPQCAFLFLSSAAIYGNPTSLPVSEEQPPAPLSAYGYHKWQSEILCQEYARVFGLKTASARLFSAYGPGLRRQVMWDILFKILTQEEVVLQGDGRESRDFIHSMDIAHALECILQSAPMNGEAYNVASGEETFIADLAKQIGILLGRPVSLRFSGVLPPGTPKNWRADIRRLTALGFQPRISLQQGVTAFVEWGQHEIGNLRESS